MSEPHRHHVLGSASGLLRKPAVGGEVPGGGGSALGLGGSSLSARPDLPRDPIVHPADGSASLATAARSRFPRGLLTVAQHDGGGSEPQRLPPAPGGQGQAPKKLPETDAIFANLAEQDGKPLTGATDVEKEQIMRLSIDCKATVNIGDYSRGGTTRGNTQAADHDRGCEEKYVPFGILEEDSGQVHLSVSEVPSRPVMLSSIAWSTGGKRSRRSSRPRLRTSSSRWTTARKAAGCARSSSSAW
jgi:DDE family transposase